MESKQWTTYGDRHETLSGIESHRDIARNLVRQVIRYWAIVDNEDVYVAPRIRVATRYRAKDCDGRYTRICTDRLSEIHHIGRGWRGAVCEERHVLELSPDRGCLVPAA
jgi:hypothetical protein